MKYKKNYPEAIFSFIFDTDPEITTDAEVTGDIRWQVKQIGWIIKNV